MTIIDIDVDVDEAMAGPSVDWVTTQSARTGISEGATETHVVRGHCALEDRKDGLNGLESDTDSEGEPEQKEGTEK